MFFFPVDLNISALKCTKDRKYVGSIHIWASLYLVYHFVGTLFHLLMCFRSNGSCNLFEILSVLANCLNEALDFILGPKEFSPTCWMTTQHFKSVLGEEVWVFHHLLFQILGAVHYLNSSLRADRCRDCVKILSELIQRHQKPFIFFYRPAHFPFFLLNTTFIILWFALCRVWTSGVTGFYRLLRQIEGGGALLCVLLWIK